MKANKEQLQAIKHTDGPLLVVAGAGTGKTTVVTERIRYLVEKGFAQPNEILALTFTEKAAKEMADRIDMILSYGYTDMWIMTFHSFCEKVLRQNALDIGLDPDFKLMTGADSVQLFRKNIFRFELSYFRPLGNPNKFIDGLIQHFSRLQDEDINPDDYKKWVEAKLDKEDELERQKYSELASAYKTYEQLKIEGSFLDFGDLITKTLKLFRDRPNILKEYQKRFKYILIDEFQDTNFSQNCLAVLLANTKQQNIFVVGDDDQSIYRFRGAAVSNIIQFRKNFKKAKTVTLVRNYRSTQEILDRSYDLIQYNNPDRLEVVEKIAKKLISDSKIKGENVKFIYSNRVEDEVEEVTLEIEKLLIKGYKPKDIAILVRANSHSEPFVRSLTRHGIPCQFLGPERLFRQNEIIDLISYLRVLVNYEDSPSFYRVLTMPEFDISAREIAKLGNIARKFNMSLFEAAEKSEDEKVQILINIVNKHLGLIRTQLPGSILYDFLDQTGVLKSLVNLETEDAEKRAVNISKFFDKIKRFESESVENSIFSIVEFLDLSSELGESPLASDNNWDFVDAVNILTVHSSKGLEFPVVFLVNLVSQRFPTTQRRDQIPIPEKIIKEVLPKGDYHLEEERRLFYVGMTRAKELLYLTAANYYGDGKRSKKLSPFIKEALGDQMDKNPFPFKRESSFVGFGKKIKTKKEKVKKLEINYLSYSQIETFKICPLHYKLRYILKVPTTPTSSQSFGISIHNALKDFYLAIKDGVSPNKELLYEFLKKDFIHEGFLSKEHEKEFFKKGKDYLKQYLEKRFSTEMIPEVMEESFVIPVSKNLKIGGKIDRVDKLSDGKIEIWDYKTGATVPTQKEVDNNLQLTFYALAASILKMKPFGKLPDEIKLSLYYFEGDKKIITTRTKSDLEKAKEEIIKIRDEIERSDFKCSGGFLCQNCEYKSLCNIEE